MNNFNNKNIVLIIGVLLVAMVGMIGFTVIIDARERQEEMMKEIEELKEKNEKREEKEDKEEVIEDELIIVPDVTGMDVEIAKDELIKAGFERILFNSVENDEYGENIVVSVFPKSGQKVTTSTEVVLNISRGSSRIVVEDYTGKNYLEVKATLETLGLVVTVEYREGNSSSNGTIIMQSINKGTELKSGDSIILYVAKEIAKYPDFTDGSYTVEDVKSFCNEYGVTLKIQNISHNSKSGTIVEQSRKAGYTVVEGTTLTIKVSTGN